MNWKSTTLVSGAGLLATWFAGVAPSSVPTRSEAPAAQRAPVSAPAPVSSEIIHLADQLERRNRTEDTFDRPSRNPFRFGAGPRVERAAGAVPAAVVAPAPEPPPMLIHFSGVAMDRVGDSDVWTAIFGTPAGLVLAREGEPVTDGWVVTTIEAERVALTRPDGSVLQLPLSGK